MTWTIDREPLTKIQAQVLAGILARETPAAPEEAQAYSETARDLGIPMMPALQFAEALTACGVSMPNVEATLLRCRQGGVL